MVTLQTRNNSLLRKAGRESSTHVWFIPGFADSSRAFLPLFQLDVPFRCTLVAPDLPGFGVSPAVSKIRTVSAYARFLKQLINDDASIETVGLVGHSSGSLIAVKLARMLGDKCRGVVSIEGNLTRADAYFSGQTVKYAHPDDFKSVFVSRILAKAETDPVLQYYASSLLQADAETMWRFGRNVYNTSRAKSPGLEFLSLPQPHLYYWNKDNTPQDTQDFIKQNSVPQKQFRKASHWPMIDAAPSTARILKRFFKV